ncbi:MAG: efflux RND transporter periplasmic adaptor subunit [Planctomycetota bacterium]
MAQSDSALSPVAQSRMLRKLAIPAALLLGASVAAWCMSRDRPLPPTALFTLQATRFRVPHQVQGTIEAQASKVVQSGCQWTVPILSLLPEGTFVQKDQVVCVLDSSQIEEFLRSREIALIRANAALTASLQQQQLQQTAAERRLSDARYALQNAQLELAETLEGTFPAQLDRLESEIAVSETQAQTATDDRNFLSRLWMLGLANHAEVAASQLLVTSRTEQRRRQAGQQQLLQTFSIPRTRRQLEHRVEMLELNLARTDLANSLAETRSRMIALADQRRLDIYERYARTARESIAASTLKAPATGRLIHANNWYARSRGIRTIEEGRSVYFSQPIFEIPDESRLKVSFPINETLLSRVSVGQSVEVSLPGREGDVVGATIERISSMPRIRRVNGIELAEYWADAWLQPTAEQRQHLHPRMDAMVTFSLADHRDAIVVPRSAIQRRSEGPCVFLQDPAQPHLVRAMGIKTGEIHEDQVHVVAGLRPGDRILLTVPQ